MIDYAMTEGERPRKRIGSMWGRWVVYNHKYN